MMKGLQLLIGFGVVVIQLIIVPKTLSTRIKEVVKHSKMFTAEGVWLVSPLLLIVCLTSVPQDLGIPHFIHWPMCRD